MELFPIRFLHVGGQEIPAYPFALVSAALVCAALLWLSGRGHGLKKWPSARLAVLTALLGLFFARLAYCCVRYEYLFWDEMDGHFLGLLPFFAPDQGGLSMSGMLLGAFLAALLDALLAKEAAGVRLDALALPLAIFTALVRFSAILAGEGYGMQPDGFLRFFPLAVQDAFGDWWLAVFMLQGIAALAIAAYLLFTSRRGRMPGAQYLRLMIPLCAADIFLESLRQDDYLRLESNGFIRVGQVLALVYLVVAAIVITVRGARAGIRWPRMLWRWAVLALAALAALAAEFNEKLPASTELLYALSAAAQAIAAVAWLRSVNRLPAPRPDEPRA